MQAINEPQPPYGRLPTDAERFEQERLFPNLQRWSVTGEEDDNYNCIGWSLGGEQFGWVWPGDSIADFDALYESQGYIVSDNDHPERGKRKIALFCDAEGVPTHAAREVADGGWWESKKGHQHRILHRLAELEGGFYGNVQRRYEKPAPSANVDLNLEGEEI